MNSTKTNWKSTVLQLNKEEKKKQIIYSFFSYINTGQIKTKVKEIAPNDNKKQLDGMFWNNRNKNIIFFYIMKIELFDYKCVVD
jgi:hypothetical protein